MYTIARDRMGHRPVLLGRKFNTLKEAVIEAIFYEKLNACVVIYDELLGNIVYSTLREYWVSCCEYYEVYLLYNGKVIFNLEDAMPLDHVVVNTYSIKPNTLKIFISRKCKNNTSNWIKNGF